MTSLKGQFLVAAGSLTDPNFSRAVVLVVQHDADGAVGVVVNRPMDVTVRAACRQVLGVACDVDGPLHHGGPCEAVLLVLYPDSTGEPTGNATADPTGSSSELAGDDGVLPGLRVTTDKDHIERLLRAGTPGLKVIVGYSGWGGGQLEAEMATGSWLTVPATAARALGPAGPLWTRLVTEANLGRYVDPRLIPDDPSAN